MTRTATLRNAQPARVLIELNEWQKKGPKEDAKLSGLSVLDSESLQRELDALRSQIDIRQLHDGIEIKTTSFVGRVDVGPVSLIVRPKLPAMPLAQLLRYAYGLQDLSMRRITRALTARYGFHDLLISMLASEVRELLRRGLSRHYVSVQERLASPRGRLMVSALARRGGLPEATLDCKYHQRSADWLLNQVLRAGLVTASRMTRDPALQREMYELAVQFDLVRAKSKLLERELKVVERGLTRITDFNAPSLTIIRLLHDMMGVDFQGSEDTNPMPGFLFDMNRFFQRLLSRFLRENLPGATIVDEERIRHVFAYAADANPKRRSAPLPRPDYALMRENKLEGFLDAKYRDVWRLNVTESWIYQLAMYALASPRRASIMLYPSLDAGARDERLEVRQPLGSSKDRPATVTMRPVPLMQLAELLGSNRPAATADRWRLAEHLVDFAM
jgi:5-methylcytosine-specific restriction enzyme subunit McrC